MYLSTIDINLLLCIRPGINVDMTELLTQYLLWRINCLSALLYLIVIH